MVKKTLKVLIALSMLLTFLSSYTVFQKGRNESVVEASTAPQATLTLDTTSFTTNPITISAVGTDTVNGMKQIKKPDGTYTSGSSTTYTVTSNGTYYFDFENNIGDITTKSIVVSNIDESPPFVWSSTIEPETKTNQNVTLYIDAGDTDSGVKQITLPNGDIVSQRNISYTVSQNGDYRFIIEDNIGRITQHTVTVSNIDKTSPVVDSVTLFKDINNYYEIHVKTSDSSGISSVVTNMNQALTKDLEDYSHYFINKLTSNTLPTYIDIKDELGNSLGNVSFLDMPTILEKPRQSIKDNVILELNGTGTLTYKKDYKTYSCSSKPCIVTVLENSTITVINQNGNKVSSQEYQVNSINRETTKFTLSGSRNTSNANNINLKWNQSLTSGKVTCKTPEGIKTYTVSGTSYTIVGKNFEYSCSVEGASNGTNVKSNWLTFLPNYNQAVVFSKPSDTIPVTTFDKSINVFVEKDGLGEFYFINSKSKNVTTNSVPVPTGL